MHIHNVNHTHLKSATTSPVGQETSLRDTKTEARLAYIISIVLENSIYGAD
jgi:hypothetical protein